MGTGINTHPQLAAQAIKIISAETGLPFRESENHFEAQAGQDASVHVSGALKFLAVSLIKIANDLVGLLRDALRDRRDRVTGHTAGSSIMPGKVNPVLCESVIQVAAHVVGCDATITLCGQTGNFELNVTMPLVTLKLLEAIEFTANAINALTEKCVIGVEANEPHCRELVEKSLTRVTAVAPALTPEQLEKALDRGA